jgi:hypothetical protein
VRIPLWPAPDEAWSGHFQQPISEYFAFTSKGAGAKVRRGGIEFFATEANLPERLEDIDQRIAGTNRWYDEVYLPQLAKQKADKAAVEAGIEDERARIIARLKGK